MLVFFLFVLVLYFFPLLLFLVLLLAECFNISGKWPFGGLCRDQKARQEEGPKELIHLHFCSRSSTSCYLLLVVGLSPMFNLLLSVLLVLVSIFFSVLHLYYICCCPFLFFCCVLYNMVLVLRSTLISCSYHFPFCFVYFLSSFWFGLFLRFCDFLLYLFFCVSLCFWLLFFSLLFLILCWSVFSWIVLYLLGTINIEQWWRRKEEEIERERERIQDIYRKED